jgi:hypothetical protein
MKAILFDDFYRFMFVNIQTGSIGLGALIFVILVAILAYRVYAEYFRSRYDK